MLKWAYFVIELALLALLVLKKLMCYFRLCVANIIGCNLDLGGRYPRNIVALAVPSIWKCVPSAGTRASC